MRSAPSLYKSEGLGGREVLAHSLQRHPYGLLAEGAVSRRPLYKHLFDHEVQVPDFRAIL